MNKFEVVSEFQPKGDQPNAIKELKEGLDKNISHQTLKGITGSGKSATIAWLIEECQLPSLVLAPNKALAAQLANEFRQFFPKNRVEYFVSYYDYYQPEAYVPRTDTFIEKDANINEEIDRLRHSATSALLLREDVIVVSSVSCIYGLGSPVEYRNKLIPIIKGKEFEIDNLLLQLVKQQYVRNDLVVQRGSFRLKGDTLDIFPVYEETIFRIEFFGDEIENISRIDPTTGEILEKLTELAILPASHYVISDESRKNALSQIEKDMLSQVKKFESENKLLEAQRIEQRTKYDLEMLITTGSCQGIENYSRYLSGRKPGEPPPTLFEYIPNNSLLFIDESHVTVPQIGGMFKGDFSRKTTLSEHGFRLPSCKDNRPLKFEEWEYMRPKTIFISATPGEWELNKTEGVFAEQVIRPTGLVDPICIVKPAKNQIDDLLHEIQNVIKNNERILVTTLTKKMAENITDFLKDNGVKVKYLHSDIDTVERMEIIRDLRLGEFDVLVGINLLREGLDIPECSMVAILDADREGFLRSRTSLIQTIGRAARNINGKVLIYADTITKSIKEALSETDRRRKKQIAWNEKNNITPKSINKRVENLVDEITQKDNNQSEDVTKIKPGHNLKKYLKQLKLEMYKEAEELNFERAAEIRDEISKLEKSELNI